MSNNASVQPNDVRAVNLKPPAYMRAAAKRGVQLHEEGFSGDGVRPQTVEDARKMASGTVTAEKWRKIGPWIARHLVDLDAVEGDEVTPGLVAHLLWGSGPSKSDAKRAMEYANDVVGRLEEERDAMNNTQENREVSIEIEIETGNDMPSDYTEGEVTPEGNPLDMLVSHLQMAMDCVDEIKATEMPMDAPMESEVDAPTEMLAKHEEKSHIKGEARWATTAQDGKRVLAFTNQQVRASADGMTVVGYAAVFDSPSEPLPWTEYVKRGAFRKTINDGADVRLLVDHEGVPLARTRSGTLQLTEDEYGLRVEAQLDETNPDAARVMSALRRGDISQMSFAFETVQDSWSKDKRTRELKEVKLFDVSIVTYPAYEETTVALRSDSANSTEAVTIKTSSLALRRAQIAIQRQSTAVRQPS
tara:strand:- start:507 stop:1757 length:1251 start_codon:yes stop_codon:yes gene_type:complete